MIEFSEAIGFWSKFTYWYVVINAIVTAVFLLVVIVGGLFDLKFLIRALREAKIDETDDGRVITEAERASDTP